MASFITAVHILGEAKLFLAVRDELEESDWQIEV